MTFGVGWCLIPPQVLGDNRLSQLEKLLVGRILGLLGNRGYCFASNKWLGGQFGCSESSVSKSLTKLNKLGVVKVKVYKTKKGTNRRIYCDVMFRGGRKNLLTGVGKNEYHSNRDLSNRDNNRLRLNSYKKNGLSTISQALGSRLKQMEKEKPARNIPEWMRFAWEVADKLGVDWNNKEIVEGKVKARWLSLFKRSSIGKLQSTYAFMADYPTPLDSVGKIKMFFWKMSHD